jgi:hypothetical protein
MQMDFKDIILGGVWTGFVCVRIQSHDGWACVNTVVSPEVP